MKLTVTIDPIDTTAVNAQELSAIALPLLESRGLQGAWELECRVVDVAEMQALNTQAQGRNEPTDILSFPIHFATNEVDPHTVLPSDGPQLLGSLVICPEVLATQAGEKGITLKEELDFMLAHGVRHLLGDDHDDNAQWVERTQHDQFSPRTDVIHGTPPNRLV